MTWNPLRKQYVTQRPAPAQPCLTVAEDRELDITVQRIIQWILIFIFLTLTFFITYYSVIIVDLCSVENTVRRMIKEMKKYLTTIEHLDSVDQRLTTNLSSCSLVHINDEFRKIVEDYHSVTTQIEKTAQDTVALCNKTFIEPLKKLKEEFAYIRDALAKREELVNNWKISHGILKKYQEKRDKTASHHVKLERERRAEEIASKELKIYHGKLLAELPMFLEKRLEYLNPTVQALIAIQLDYYGNSTKMFTQLMPVSNASESPSSATISEEEHQQTINRHFNQIRNLTIIKND